MTGHIATPLITADRVNGIAVSEILQIAAKAARLKATGRPVIVLGQGEPDFDTPDNIKEAACRAIAAGATKYTPLDGTPELKRAVQRKFSVENGLEFDITEITIAPGGKQIIYNAFMATLNAGDEVILAAPFWTSYADIVTIADGKPVPVPCREANGFRLAADELEAAITPHTRWLLLNSPSNPSGATYSARDLQALAEVLRRHPNVWLLSDDIYEHLVYDEDKPFATMLQVAPDLRGRTLTMNGVSKAYAMTGWRIGYAAGPKELVKAMAIVQSQSSSNPCSISQMAAVEALTGPQEILASRRAAFKTRRDLVVAMLNETKGLTCRTPEGAFYVYPGCAGVLGLGTPQSIVLKDDRDFCDYLLEAADVAVVPGACFGLAPHFRISYAASIESLKEACARIQAACMALS
jgi:aspartate aminotransferase